MKKRTRWIFAAVGLLVGAGLLWLLFRPSGITVDVVEARADTVSVTVDEEGRTRVRERYVVAAPTTGRVSRTDLEAGARVERGQALATLAPPPDDARSVAIVRAEVDASEARLAEARAAVQEAEGAYERARREAERRRRLFEDVGSFGRETVERFETEAEAARTRLEGARATVRAARASLEAARSRLLGVGAGASSTGEAVEAPVTGTLLRVHEESERVVQAGTPLFEISGAVGLEVVVDVRTEEAVQIEPGAPIHLTGWGGEAVLEGRVRYIEPEAFTEVSALGVEEQRVNVVADLQDDPPSGLGAGFRVDASIVTWRGEDVLSVPASAVFQRGGAWRTFVVEDGRARMRTIEVGRRGDERVQVQRGLDEGDRVIVFPSDAVEDGIRVTPEPSGSAGAS